MRTLPLLLCLLIVGCQKPASVPTASVTTNATAPQPESSHHLYPEDDKKSPRLKATSPIRAKN